MAQSVDDLLDSSKKITDDEFDNGPVSLDEIEKGLFLGNLTAATHTETLKKFNITFILTLDSVPLPAHIVEAPFLTTKFIQISDMPKEDILHHFDECINFIDSALKANQNILVHCYFGVSRSSTIVIAYLMKKHNLEYSQAFEKVKAKRKFVQPNDGFIFQLKLFRRMHFKIDPQYPKYKTYRLRLAADKVKKAKILPQCCMDLVKPDPSIIRENPEPIVYRCRKCRRILATKSNLIVHVKKNKELQDKNLIKPKMLDNTSNYVEEDDVKDKEKNIENTKTKEDSKVYAETGTAILEQLRKCSLSEKSSVENENCKNIIFIEPIIWMKDIFRKTQGRLNCPKCNQKIGNFSWINGCPCPCGAEIAPAFYLVSSKVELSHIVQNVQMTF